MYLTSNCCYILPSYSIFIPSLTSTYCQHAHTHTLTHTKDEEAEHSTDDSDDDKPAPARGVRMNSAAFSKAVDESGVVEDKESDDSDEAE